MIVAQANRTLQSLKRAEDLKKVQSKHEHLQATLDKLQRVDQALVDLISVHNTISDCLTGEMHSNYWQGFGGLLEALEQSRQQFESEPRQVDSLRGVQQRIVRLRRLLDRAWYIAAHPQFEQYEKLANLVRSLPEVQDQLSDIDRLISLLRGHLNAAPSDLDARCQHDADMKRLAEHLESIEGLNDRIRRFLSRVAEGKATLADVNEDVLEWCKQERRSVSFAISFRIE